MSNLEEEILEMRKKNTDLVLKVQYWKMMAAQRENEKLDLMKEMNELRLKLSRIRSGGAAEARKLEVAVQAASEQALSHLVQASNAVANNMERIKLYIQDRQEVDMKSPRWSAISGTPTTEKVHKVRPMLLGGRSLQPVVSLSRTVLDTSSRTVSRVQTSNVTERAVPMHMLQDVYIPLTRVDMGNEWTINNLEQEDNADDSTENLGLDDDNDEDMDESGNISESEDIDVSRRLDVVEEDSEPEGDVETPPPPLRDRIENPLEGPSWLLDGLQSNSVRQPNPRTTLEPDSTTEPEETIANPTPTASNDTRNQHEHAVSPCVARAFTPTQRRKRAAALTHQNLHALRYPGDGRELQVLLPKIQLESMSPAKRPALQFHSPSPNGATDHRVIVSETSYTLNNLAGGDPARITVRNRSRDTPNNLSLELNDSCQMQHDSRSEEYEMPRCQISNVSRRQPASVVRNLNHTPETSDGDGRVEQNVTHRVRSVSRHNRDLTHEEANVSRDNDSEVCNELSETSTFLSESHNNRSESRNNRSKRSVSRNKRVVSNDERSDSRMEVGESREQSSRDSDSGSGSEQVSEGRTRRPRKPVVYKEKPLNRKLRR